MIAAGDALVMAAWMYVRGHGVRHNVEMSGATLLGAVPFVAAPWLGLIPDDRLVSWNALFAFMCGPVCVLMLAVMLARFGHYGAHSAVLTIAASTRPKGGYTCSMHPEVDSSAPGRCPVCGMKLVLRST